MSQRRSCRRQFLAFNDELDLRGVQGLTLEQSRSHTVNYVLVCFEYFLILIVGSVHKALHFSVNLFSSIIREIAVLRDLAAEEDLLFLLAES